MNLDQRRDWRLKKRPIGPVRFGDFCLSIQWHRTPTFFFRDMRRQLPFIYCLIGFWRWSIMVGRNHRGDCPCLTCDELRSFFFYGEA